MTRRLFNLLGIIGICTAWTHGTTNLVTNTVIDDNGVLVVDDLGNQVITS